MKKFNIFSKIFYLFDKSIKYRATTTERLIICVNFLWKILDYLTCLRAFASAPFNYWLKHNLYFSANIQLISVIAKNIYS